jgi:lipopolysaccharide transport system ATP-binding protein
MTATGVQPVLAVEGLGKEYRLYDSPRARLASLVTGRQHYRSQWALKDVSFALHRGQCMGVIGDNGAGKSTLLKLLAGTLQPSAGRLRRPPRITAILELGAGFHPEFTGRDNLYFAGSLIGIDAERMAQLEAGIVAFSELGEAIDWPVKTYSSGMVVRLAFALVTAVEPDVLIIDEALAVGDQHFQKKCVERIEAFRRNGCTILFCSHSMYHVRRLCNTAVWLKNGRVEAQGETEAVLAAYEAHSLKQDARDGINEPAEKQAGQSASPAPAAEVQPQGARPTGVLPEGRRAGIIAVEVADLLAGDPPLLDAPDLRVTVRAKVQASERPQMAVMLEQSRGVGITSVATHVDGFAAVREADGSWRATVTFPQLPLHTGEYVLSAYLFDSEGIVVYDEWFKHLHFKLVRPGLLPGLVDLPHRWS